MTNFGFDEQSDLPIFKSAAREHCNSVNDKTISITKYVMLLRTYMSKTEQPFDELFSQNNINNNAEINRYG